jgi:hypothetical protein
MSVLDDLTSDLGSILTAFSKSEKVLNEAAKVKMQKKDIVSVHIDTYEDLDYPIVRHTFYGRTEKEALGYLEAHRITDKLLKGCQKGAYEGMACNNTKPTIRKIPLASIKASGKSKPSKLKKDAIKGKLAKKLGL